MPIPDRIERTITPAQPPERVWAAALAGCLHVPA
jgi:hypothetical protein